MVMTGAEIPGVVSGILSIAQLIMSLANTAQRNREKCKDLRDHVEAISRLIDQLKNQLRPEDGTMVLLEDLNDALRDGRALVESCQVKRTWSRLFKTQKKANKFDALDKRISKILERFHIANMALILSMNNVRFVENVLHKLLDDGACKRLPQTVKEDLKSSINRLTNTHNMSPDAQKLLERIKGDITYRGQLATIGSSSGAQRGTASSSGDNLMVDILESTKRIKQQARPDNGGEVQRLVNLVQDLTNIIQHLQTSQMLPDPSTRQTLVRLKEDLDGISDTMGLYNRKEHNKVKRVMRCGPDNDYELLKDAYKIEYYIQVLVIALRQLYERT